MGEQQPEGTVFIDLEDGGKLLKEREEDGNITPSDDQSSNSNSNILIAKRRKLFAFLIVLVGALASTTGHTSKNDN